MNSNVSVLSEVSQGKTRLFLTAPTTFHEHFPFSIVTFNPQALFRLSCLFCQAEAPGSSAFQAPFGYTRVLPGARPELHVFSPTDMAFLQGSTSMELTDAAPAAATAPAPATNSRSDPKDRVNAHPHPVRSTLLKPVPRMDLVRC